MVQVLMLVAVAEQVHIMITLMLQEKHADIRQVQEIPPTVPPEAGADIHKILIRIMRTLTEAEAVEELVALADKEEATAHMVKVNLHHLFLTVQLIAAVAEVQVQQQLMMEP